MKSLEIFIQDKRLFGCKWKENSEGVFFGQAYIMVSRRTRDAAFVIFSNNDGWDHISVSFPNRDPSWEEMCIAKDVFFGEEERCVEYHPPRSEYVNLHKHCLHIWKPQGVELPHPN